MVTGINILKTHETRKRDPYKLFNHSHLKNKNWYIGIVFLEILMKNRILRSLRSSTGLNQKFSSPVMTRKEYFSLDKEENCSSG
jgi:hypothetical protein